MVRLQLFHSQSLTGDAALEIAPATATRPRLGEEGMGVNAASVEPAHGPRVVVVQPPPGTPRQSLTPGPEWRLIIS